MRQLDNARAVLASLVDDVVRDQLWTSREDPGFTRLTEVVRDTGRAVVPRDPSDVRETLPALAALREVLEGHYLPESIAKNPFEALQGEKATPYAAGALWATSSVLYAALGRQDAQAERTDGKLERRSVRERVLEVFRQRGTVRPVDVRQELAEEGRPMDKSMVSRCLGDLLESGDITPVEPSATKDRRYRYYRLVDERSATGLAAERARQAAWELLTMCEADEAKRLLVSAVDEVSG